MGWLDGLLGGGTGGDERAPSPDVERELVLYKYNSCPYCQRVLRALRGMEDVVQVEFRDTMRDPGARSALIQATGRTTVPCLFIDGEPLFESADIVRWLNRYAEARRAA